MDTRILYFMPGEIIKQMGVWIKAASQLGNKNQQIQHTIDKLLLL